MEGAVQGVGFRDWTRRRALARGLAGAAVNLADGRVEVTVEGPAEDCRALLAELRGGQGPGRVESVHEQWDAARGMAGFAAR